MKKKERCEKCDYCPECGRSKMDTMVERPMYPSYWTYPYTITWGSGGQTTSTRYSIGNSTEN